MAIGLTVALTGCGHAVTPKQEAAEMEWTTQRAAMLKTLRQHGLRDEHILASMAAVRRDRFIPEPFRRDDAYGDHPLPIGHGQTISQPFIVAYMTWKMNLAPGSDINCYPSPRTQ